MLVFHGSSFPHAAVLIFPSNLLWRNHNLNIINKLIFSLLDSKKTDISSKIWQIDFTFFVTWRNWSSIQRIWSRDFSRLLWEKQTFALLLIDGTSSCSNRSFPSSTDCTNKEVVFILFISSEIHWNLWSVCAGDSQLWRALWKCNKLSRFRPWFWWLLAE